MTITYGKCKKKIITFQTFLAMWHKLGDLGFVADKRFENCIAVTFHYIKSVTASTSTVCLVQGLVGIIVAPTTNLAYRPINTWLISVMNDTFHLISLSATS